MIPTCYLLLCKSRLVEIRKLPGNLDKQSVDTMDAVSSHRSYCVPALLY